MANYSIEDGFGNELSAGIQSDVVARRAAQSHASRLGKTVYLYEGVGNEPEEFEPAVDHAARVARAASRIDATELADGRWAHYADETSRWYVVTADELEELCDYLDSDDEQVSGDAYSHWCAGTSAQEMPKGWTPDAEPAVELPEDAVLVETMPDDLRASHEVAGNWGSYPHNGAVRRVMAREDAEALCEDDDYNHIVKDRADADDARNYGVEVVS